jgi:hypothetical protein
LETVKEIESSGLFLPGTGTFLAAQAVSGWIAVAKVEPATGLGSAAVKARTIGRYTVRLLVIVYPTF